MPRLAPGARAKTSHHYSRPPTNVIAICDGWSISSISVLTLEVQVNQTLMSEPLPLQYISIINHSGFNLLTLTFLGTPYLANIFSGSSDF